MENENTCRKSLMNLKISSESRLQHVNSPGFFQWTLSLRSRSAKILLLKLHISALPWCKFFTLSFYAKNTVEISLTYLLFQPWMQNVVIYRLEIQSIMLVFSTQFVNCCPPNLLSGSTLLPPPTFSVSKYSIYVQTVCGWDGVWGVLSPVGGHILQKFQGSVAQD